MSQQPLDPAPAQRETLEQILRQDWEEFMAGHTEGSRLRVLHEALMDAALDSAVETFARANGRGESAKLSTCITLRIMAERFYAKAQRRANLVMESKDK